MYHLLRIPSVLTGLGVWLLLYAASAVQGLAVSLSARVAATVILVLVVVGWPTLIVCSLSSLANGLVRVPFVLAAFLATLFFHGVVNPGVMVLSDGSRAWDVGLAVIGIPFGLIAPVYVLWSASRLLVSVEEGAAVGWDRCVGTFLLFFFLPIGVFFLQRRVLRIQSLSVRSGVS